MNFQKITKIVAAILGLIATFSLFGIMSQGDEALRMLMQQENQLHP